MIVYKRKMILKDLSDLNYGEELIYYKEEDIAILVIKIDDDRNIVRKKRISDNDLIEEVFLNTIDEVIECIENL